MDLSENTVGIMNKAVAIRPVTGQIKVFRFIRWRVGALGSVLQLVWNEIGKNHLNILVVYIWANTDAIFDYNCTVGKLRKFYMI